jgi:RHH-type proline utilization regulon transcriptional repressor/proline dehydrogenase/delta 1-pyrroline-5-carboxylate dehydrogenase
LGVSEADLDRLGRSIASDNAAWQTEYGVMKDVSGLVVERNEFRYLPTSVIIRFGGETHSDVTDLLRVVAAGLAARGTFEVSLAEPHPALAQLLTRSGVRVSTRSNGEWATGLSDVRVRLVGSAAPSRREVAELTGPRPDVALYDQPVTESGRIEMLPFLREQAISLTAHRFGTVQPTIKL